MQRLNPAAPRSRRARSMRETGTLKCAQGRSVSGPREGTGNRTGYGQEKDRHSCIWTMELTPSRGLCVGSSAVQSDSRLGSGSAFRSCDPPPGGSEEAVCRGLAEPWRRRRVGPRIVAGQWPVHQLGRPAATRPERPERMRGQQGPESVQAQETQDMNSDRVASGATAAQSSAPGGVHAIVAGIDVRKRWLDSQIEPGGTSAASPTTSSAGALCATGCASTA